MALFAKRVPQYERLLIKEKIVSEYRLALNHAQLMAMVEALAPLIGTTEAQLREIWQFIKRMAAERQKVISQDSPVVQEFWEMYHYVNSRGKGYELNHSRNSNSEICINLNHFYAKAKDAQQSPPAISELKKALKDSRRHKFIGQRNVNSDIENKTVFCWVFEKRAGAR